MTARPPATTTASLAELVGEAFANLNAQRQRSFLALLGIMIGAGSIVAMLAIGHMAQRETLKLFRHLGADMLEVHAVPAGDGPAVLDRRLVEALPARYGWIAAAAPLVVDRTSLAAGAQSAEVGVAGVTPSLADLAGLSLRAGRFIAPVEDDSLVAVVGPEAAEALSAPNAPLNLGSHIRLRSYVFTVIGLTASVPYTALDPVDFSDSVLIPLGAARRVASSAAPDNALVRLRPSLDVQAAGARITTILANPTATLQVQSARELIRGMNSQKAINSRLLTAIGAISLLVGGIGVMNVMLMGVMERRREIGLRAAIGATPADLGLMFLIEAGALAFVGGVVGLAAGLLGAFVVARASGWTYSPPLWVAPLGPGLAGLVGLVFGLQPAIKASRLDPVEALRAD